MTFALVAFMIGGFTISANAQDDSKKKKDKDEVSATVDNAQAVVNYAQMLKDYESNINLYIEKYKESLKPNSKADWKTPLKKAEALEKKLEKAKEELNDAQIAKFIKLKEKLAAALSRK